MSVDMQLRRSNGKLTEEVWGRSSSYHREAGDWLKIMAHLQTLYHPRRQTWCNPRRGLQIHLHEVESERARPRLNTEFSRLRVFSICTPTDAVGFLRGTVNGLAPLCKEFVKSLRREVKVSITVHISPKCTHALEEDLTREARPLSHLPHVSTPARGSSEPVSGRLYATCI